jgi:RimJ/RimL family protein N-acetyltransferase
LKDNEIACECSSVFIGGGAVEINIHTNEKYRRQGLAAIAATAFISECLDRGLHPNWECWWDNQPSISLAQKLGFEPVKDHPVLLVELNT